MRSERGEGRGKACPSVETNAAGVTVIAAAPGAMGGLCETERKQRGRCAFSAKALNGRCRLLSYMSQKARRSSRSLRSYDHRDITKS